MNDLFWALYWIDVLSGIAGAVFAGSAASLVVLIGMCIAFFDGKIKITRFWWMIGPIVPFVVSISLQFVPSKQTMYLMLGVKTTENVMQSEIGQKLQQLVYQELDKLLGKKKE